MGTTGSIQYTQARDRAHIVRSFARLQYNQVYPNTLVSRQGLASHAKSTSSDTRLFYEHQVQPARTVSNLHGHFETIKYILLSFALYGQCTHRPVRIHMKPRHVT